MVAGPMWQNVANRFLKMCDCVQWSGVCGKCGKSGFCDLPPKKPRLQRMEGDFDAMWQMWHFFFSLEHACVAPPPRHHLINQKFMLNRLFFCHICHIRVKTPNAKRMTIFCVDKWWQFMWQNGFCDLPHLPHTNPVTFT